MTRKAIKSKVCSRCQRRKPIAQYTSDRGRVCGPCRRPARKRASKAAHESRVTDTYGLEPGEYDALLEAQGGVCAICHQSRKYRLNVDHCHRTGEVRGLLCRLCNGRLLTAARDDPERLRRAADYLEHPPARRVLGIRLHKDHRNEPD